MKAVIRDHESLINHAAPAIKVSYAQKVTFAKLSERPRGPFELSALNVLFPHLSKLLRIIYRCFYFKYQILMQSIKPAKYPLTQPIFILE